MGLEGVERVGRVTGAGDALDLVVERAGAVEALEGGVVDVARASAGRLGG